MTGVVLLAVGIGMAGVGFLLGVAFTVLHFATFEKRL
ncbi:hypothetical protein VAC51_00040 [Variovorax phage VAC_51]|uniref:Uncharacterized protein n=1 Tax=Variovorax phage VAC_51 TaxID=2985242 RepID=A0A9N6ZHU7_9CAUD|nr:hypothetical protein VAC51_00040 [Variovorax phage VAC_51]